MGFLFTGRLVWRRHFGLPQPSHHVLRSTCTQLLPLVEMYCKWELQEDCSNLHALMLRFDSERELESHELGRSLLFMIRDEDMGFPTCPRQNVVNAPNNPFDVIRERLAAADLAIRDLHAQVHLLQLLCLHGRLEIFLCSPGQRHCGLYVAALVSGIRILCWGVIPAFIGNVHTLSIPFAFPYLNPCPVSHGFACHGFNKAI